MGIHQDRRESFSNSALEPSRDRRLPVNAHRLLQILRSDRPTVSPPHQGAEDPLGAPILLA